MPNVNTLLDEHVVLKYESVDRLFLNAWVGNLQEPDDLGWFLAQHRGEEIPRYQLLGEMTSAFMKAVEDLAAKKQIPVVHFERGQRKEALAQPHFERAAKARHEGVVMIGIAQERAKVFRAPSKSLRERGKFRPTRNSAFVNHVYFYIWLRHEAPWDRAGWKSPPTACRSRLRKAGGSLTRRCGNQVGAAPTTTGRVGTARRPGTGKQGGKV